MRRTAAATLASSVSDVVRTQTTTLAVGKVLQLSLIQAPIQSFRGNYLVTSTNRRLEGIHRKNWWGFSGRPSCDAALHGLYNGSSSPYPNYLINAAQRAWSKQQLQLQRGHPADAATKITSESQNEMLPFSRSLVTDAGPMLQNVGKIVHTCVPRFPHIVNGDQVFEPHLHTTLPHAYVATELEAVDLLEACYDDIFDTILLDLFGASNPAQDSSSYWRSFLRITETDTNDLANMPPKRISVGLPAIGCGYNGYPIETAAGIALDSIHRFACLLADGNNTYALTGFDLEVRFREPRTLELWKDQAFQRANSQFEVMH